MSARSFLRNVAGQFGAAYQKDDAAEAIYAVQPPLPSGAPPPSYIIGVSDHAGWAVAREHPPSRLPEYCPERHINAGGEFCLFWHEAEPLRVEDEASAEKWWGKVVLFLQLQAVATKYRRWPGKADTRAHGPRAAAFQLKAEEAALRLGGRFETALRQQRLVTARRQHRGRMRVRLLLDGKRLVTVLEEPRRVMALRSTCPCDATRKRSVKDCGGHGENIADLALALDGWSRAEHEFFLAAKAAGKVCCGTIDGCPLAGSE